MQAGLERSRLAVCLAASLLAGCAGQPKPAPTSETGLLSGIGSVHHPIATQSAAAQQFFDQGLALVYGFNFNEAIRSFRRAAELDPKSPMPYWGIALANGPNYNAWKVGRDREEASIAAIHTASTLAEHAPPQEQAFVRGLAQCFPNVPRVCADAMREVYRAYPDDPDAATLFAASLMNISPWHLWTIDGKPAPDTPEIVAVLESVLRQWPDHLGANHFYIHAMEGSPQPQLALPSAHRLETLAPAAGHLVHMPSHIYLHTGDYAEAVKCNQRAEAADDAYLKLRPEAASNMGYFHHDLQFLAVAAGMDGEYQVAADAAQKLQVHAHSSAFIVMPTVVLLRFGKWDDVIALPLADPALPDVRYFQRFARGFAFASKGKVDEALAERRAMREEFAKLRPGRAFNMFFNDWSAFDGVAMGALDARIAASRGDLPGAVRLWASTAAEQDQMTFDDVPDWYYPVRESWGAALLRNGQAREAEAVFREDLRRNPRNPRSLFGLYQALESQKRDYDASLVQADFNAAWKGVAPPRIEDY